ncbi:hypothetical protein ACWDYH_31095 [Nocardia goodfellowii]
MAAIAVLAVAPATATAKPDPMIKITGVSYVSANQLDVSLSYRCGEDEAETIMVSVLAGKRHVAGSGSARAVNCDGQDHDTTISTRPRRMLLSDPGYTSPDTGTITAELGKIRTHAMVKAAKDSGEFDW